MSWLLFAILSLGSGAVIAFIALGLVVGHRGSGVINFAQGAVAMYVAYVFYGLRTSGQYFLPVPGLPGFLQVGSKEGLSLGPAFAISIATAAVLGVLVHLLVFRPLRQAPVLAKVVASIGLMVLLQAVAAYRFGTNTVSVPSVAPQDTLFRLGGGSVPSDRIVLAGCAVVTAGLLWLLYEYTRFGVVTRACSENEKGALLLGLSPQVHAGINWIVASVLAGLGGILVSPLTNLSPTKFSLLVIPALAAAMVAKFRGFGLTLIAALAIAIAQGELTAVPSHLPWFPQTGTPEAVPFVAIVVIMMTIGHSLPTRDALLDARRVAVPMARRIGPTGLLVVALCVLGLFTLSGTYRLALITSLIAAIVCLSLVVVTGYLGQISLFQLALAGIAGYVLSAVATHAGVPFPLGPILASSAAAAVGLITSIPALRVRGLNLAIITLAGGWAIEEVVFLNPDYTGGLSGAHVGAVSIFGLSVPFAAGHVVAQPSFGIFVLVVLVLMVAAVGNLRRGALGRRMLAVRTDERGAAAAGISVAGTKFVAFGVASFIAGVAGCLMAYQTTTVSPGAFAALLSVTFLAVAYLGGITSVSGALVGGLLVNGGLVFVFLTNVVFGGTSRSLEIVDLILGVGLIVTAILNPQGISGSTADMWKRVRHRGRRILTVDPGHVGMQRRGSSVVDIVQQEGEVGVR